jgi:6-phosphogluconolactonase
VRGDVVVSTDPAANAAARLADAAGSGAHIALSGGSTPRRAYEQAAELRGDWRGATVWFGDERCVPPDHPDSNYRMVSEALLDRLAGRPRVQRMAGEEDPEGAAELYEELIWKEVGGDDVNGANPPSLDLIIMGLGPDGHTASLFPGKPAVMETARLVCAVPEAGMEPYVPRVTMTLPVFNAAKEVVFLVAGEDKADAVARAFGSGPDLATPASLVAPRAGALTILLDSAAASKLETAASR